MTFLELTRKLRLQSKLPSEICECKGSQPRSAYLEQIVQEPKTGRNTKMVIVGKGEGGKRRRERVRKGGRKGRKEKGRKEKSRKEEGKRGGRKCGRKEEKRKGLFCLWKD